MSPLLALGRSEGIARARERFRRLWGDGDGPLSGLTDLPETIRSGRLALDGVAIVAVGAVALIGVLVAGWFAWRGSADTQPVARTSVVAPGVALAQASSPSRGRPGALATPASLLVIDVAGRVRRPGLVRVPAGSRVADALAAAGGTLAGVDLATINLARPVVDGEQILVGIAGAGAGGAGSSGSSVVAAGPLDLNAATLEQLEALPGVGPVLAQKILDWRTAHGRFSNVDELREVGGIGDKKYGDIAPKVRV
jgi:competence protein ComEA